MRRILRGKGWILGIRIQRTRATGEIPQKNHCRPQRKTNLTMSLITKSNTGSVVMGGWLLRVMSPFCATDGD